MYTHLFHKSYNKCFYSENYSLLQPVQDNQVQLFIDLRSRLTQRYKVEGSPGVSTDLV